MQSSGDVLLAIDHELLGRVLPMGCAVSATDVSPAMMARQRLGTLPNATFAVEDAQALTFPMPVSNGHLQHGE